MMPAMGRLPRQGRQRVVVPTSPQAVWAVISDPTRVGEWSHETKAATWLEPWTGPVVGARFTGANVQGRARWSRINEIVAIEPGRSISWITVPSKVMSRDSTRWTMRVEPCDAATVLTQEFEVLQLGPIADRIFYALVKDHRDRSAALRADLERIGEIALANPSAPSQISS